ncbi:DedA family protein [Brevibacterium renqingii]|uniref:DedA family protein n=1 Tax=Brevibacterium renqingii TaxID=2776916 RepID=UPI001ADF7650|nr:VTT domain-containing protein [Brevibacterium renqingii]
MNPLNWSFPVAVTWLILFGIILARAGGTFLLGRLARSGMRKIERVDRIMSGPKYRRAEAMIERYGAPVIAVSFLMIGVQTVLNLAAGTTGMSYRRYLPALAVGGAMWATIYSTVGLIGFKALAAGYQAAPGLTVGLAVCFALAVAGLVIGLKKPHDSSEVDVGAEAATDSNAKSTRF